MYYYLDAYDHFRSERDYKQKVEQYNSLPDMEERRLMSERSNEAQPGNKRKLPYEWRDHDSKGPYIAKLPLRVMKEGETIQVPGSGAAVYTVKRVSNHYYCTYERCCCYRTDGWVYVP